MEHGIFFSSKVECEFCGKAHKDNCLFAEKDSLTMRQVLKKLNHDRDFELVVQWHASHSAVARVVDSWLT